jgi:glyoxylase-like metal-dependent hydrolase (beta-lactamase superfamily II)
MRVHHLDCGTLCPISARLVTGRGGLFARARLVCHCLLLESNAGLVLVETGIGLQDIADPRSRLGRRFLLRVNPRLDPEQTAARQVERLGFARKDVRHIVLTHAHIDHAGGIADFPEATVHLYEDEQRALEKPPTPHERRLYHAPQWAHRPRWAPHALQGERWHGFDAVRAIPELVDDVLLVPLAGHTRGHAAVAVRTEQGWLLHAGDSYFHRGQLQPEAEKAPALIEWFQRQTDLDPAARVHNLRRLRALKESNGSTIRMFCAHDAEELDAFRA